MKNVKEENIKSTFLIDYKRECVKFGSKIFDKKKMGLKEFAILVLEIDPISIEIIAMYIGKLGFDTYNKSNYKITISKKTKNGIKGIIEINKK